MWLAGVICQLCAECACRCDVIEVKQIRRMYTKNSVRFSITRSRFCELNSEKALLFRVHVCETSTPYMALSLKASITNMLSLSTRVEQLGRVCSRARSARRGRPRFSPWSFSPGENGWKNVRNLGQREKSPSLADSPLPLLPGRSLQPKLRM